MFTQEGLIKQFGNWCTVYWLVLQPLFEAFKERKCLFSLTRSSTHEHEAICTFKFESHGNQDVPWAHFSQLMLKELQGKHLDLCRQCLDVSCHRTRLPGQWSTKLEFWLIDSQHCTAEEVNLRHKQMSWAPQQTLEAALKICFQAQLEQMLSDTSVLEPESQHRVMQTVKLYCISDERTPPPKIVILPKNPNTMIIDKARYISLSWCVYMTSQHHLGIAYIEMVENEIHVHYDPPLRMKRFEHELEAGPVKKKQRSWLSRLQFKLPW